MSTDTIEASYGLYYASESQLKADGREQTWITRSANVVLAISKVSAGAVLTREDNPDEFMLLLPPAVRARVSSAAQTVEAGPDTLTIMPPGKTSIHVLDDGVVARVFSARATDLCALASNAAVYAHGAPAVAALEDWPMPVGGYKIRSYALAGYADPKIFGRIFRSRNLMINVFERKTAPRDPSKLSPHSHGDFEQISLALEGTFIHHLRTPWGADSFSWKADEHVEVKSPSAIVIPANVIHTTQAVGYESNWLVDIFGPPRVDFSEQAGVVRNANEYPMP